MWLARRPGHDPGVFLSLRVEIAKQGSRSVVAVHLDRLTADERRFTQIGSAYHSVAWWRRDLSDVAKGEELGEVGSVYPEAFRG
jgi:hypothetical protein